MFLLATHDDTRKPGLIGNDRSQRSFRFDKIDALHFDFVEFDFFAAGGEPTQNRGGERRG
jgi:hypothetical protein